MKLVSRDAAIATHTVVADEIKPLNGYYLHELFRQIGERYALKIVPSIDEAAKTGAKFVGGQFRVGEREINITELAIFNDGFKATTTDTADSELVVVDLFSWLKDQHGFREPAKKPFRTFQSDLIVDFETDPSQALGFLTPILALLQKEMDAVSNIETPFQFNRIGLAYEGAPGATEFLLERRVGIPWNAKRYFCKAYLTTDAHLRVLELLDGLLTAKA